MKYHEYGSGHKETILLLHGGGLSWWNYRDAAALLQNEYRVILPVLDGHAGSGRPFTSIEDNASEIISFIDEHCGGSVVLIGGLSLGGQILLEMLSQRNDICPFALVESAPVIPSKLTNSLTAAVIGSSYGLIKHRGFASLQFRALHIKQELFEDYYRDTCRISKNDMTAFIQANTSYSLKKSFCHASAEINVYFGEKETGIIKRSVGLIHEQHPDVRLHPLRGYRHGDFSINHPDEYADAVRRIIRGS